MTIKWILLSVLLLTLFGGALVGPLMSRVEQPDYDVISTRKKVQIRQYAPAIIAEVAVQGERQEAIRAGFRLLADYIFGNNTVQQKIAMTAPVQQEKSLEISMTAPIQQQASADTWKVSFVMPSAYRLEMLPRPNNPRVTLKEFPGKRAAVIRFSGGSSSRNLRQHEEALRHDLAEAKLTAVGAPIYAFYNPPWTLPFLRRNEIIIELADAPH